MRRERQKSALDRSPECTGAKTSIACHGGPIGYGAAASAVAAKRVTLTASRVRRAPSSFSLRVRGVVGESLVYTSAGEDRACSSPCTIIGHLLRALRRSVSRVFLLFLVSGLIAVVVTEIIDIIITGALPNIYANGVALALGLAVGYTAALMTLVWEVFRDLIRDCRGSGKEFHQRAHRRPSARRKRHRAGRAAHLA